MVTHPPTSTRTHDEKAAASLQSVIDEITELGIEPDAALRLQAAKIHSRLALAEALRDHAEALREYGARA